MRVALVIYGSLDTVSGGYLYDRKLVEYLTHQGDEVEIICLPWRNYARHLADNLSTDWRRRLEGDFDVIVQDELNHPSLAWINNRLRQPAPLVAIVHHLRCSEPRPSWQNRVYRAIERQYLNSVDAFIFNSRTTKGVVSELLAESKPHIVAYPAGDRFGTTMATEEIVRRSHSGPLQLLFVGNLIPRKGLHTLLAALTLCQSFQWQLHVVGSLDIEPAYTDQIQNLLQRWKLEERVTLSGVLNGEDLARAMASAHLLVMPSAYEGFGIVYLEGMGFGLAAIATTAGATGEVIADSENGFLIPPDNPNALANCLLILAVDRDRLAQMSLAALARYACHPTWADSTAAIRKFLLGLIG
jgi:glycosyltransferase involved in cell wall biosynthesis